MRIKLFALYNYTFLLRLVKTENRFSTTENRFAKKTVLTSLQRTEDNGGHSFIPIAAKWLASGTDDDDENVMKYNGKIFEHELFVKTHIVKR